MHLLWIALGGGAGSIIRFLIATTLEPRVGSNWLPTVCVNVIGCFAIGLAATWRDSDLVRNFVMVGLLGGFTTFSAFSLQTLDLLRAGRPLDAALNVLISVLACLLAVWVGSVAGMALRGGGR